ncbi:MAG TPA: hypothetical protein VK856_05870, partial [Anaerolineaceae bacterium]|nr:hypothetical protein [Anaerolineaceae bacterium]
MTIPKNLKKPDNNKKWIYIILVILVLVVFSFLMRPGVYTIQPVDGIPDGITIVYILRDAGEPFFNSLHPECVYSPTSVSLICNAMVRSTFQKLSGKIILR